MTLKYGTIIGGKKKEADMLTVTGNVNGNPVKTVFETRFTLGVWHNFGIVLDFVKG